MQNRTLLLSAALLLSSAAAVAEGETTKNDDTWKGNIDFGYTSVSGNTESTTVVAGIKAAATIQAWKNTVIVNVLNESKESDRSAERYFISDQLNRNLNDTSYVFGYLSYDDDRFSGFDYQATVSAGYGRKLIDTDTMHWDGEIGPGYRYSEFDVANADGEDNSSEAILRLSTEYDWQFSNTAAFAQTLSVETGEENTISKSSTSLKTTIIGQLALKLAYNVKYTEEVAVGKKHADTETVVSISYNF